MSPISVFISYAAPDEEFFRELDAHLVPLRRTNLISTWHRGCVVAGDDLTKQVASKLQAADVVLLLVSPSFMATDICFEEELMQAMRKPQASRSRVIPILLRPVALTDTPISQLVVLPRSGHAICLWQQRDEAWFEVVKVIRLVAETFCSRARLDCNEPTDAVMEVNPYRGLSVFRREDEHLFYGREPLIKKLCQLFDRLCQAEGQVRILTILGPSGSGKSSLAQAGLLAALGHRIAADAPPSRAVVLQPGDKPIESLARALLTATERRDRSLVGGDVAALRSLRDVLAQPSAKGIYDGLRLYAASRPEYELSQLVLLVDQFEEIYSLCSDAGERDAFVGLLIEAAACGSLRVCVIITLRSDFLGETQRYHLELNRAIGAHSLIVTGMNQQELQQAIHEPAQWAGLPIDAATAELLLRESHEREGALPLLEFALTRIWEGLLLGHSAIDTLRRIGGVGGALAGQAQSIYDTLSSSQKALCQRAMVRLAHLGEGKRATRRRVPIDQLAGRYDTEQDVLSVLRRFASAKARLLTLSSETGVTIAEVAHEALFEHWAQLRQWIEEGRVDRQFHDRSAEAARLWEEAGRPPGRLWRAPDLDLLLRYRSRRQDEMSLQQEAFLDAALAERKRGKVWRMTMIAFIAALFMAGTGVYVIKSEQIRQQLALSFAEKGRHELLKGNRSEAALWLNRAYESHARDPALRHLMAEAMESVDSIRTVFVGHEGPITEASFSPDNRRVLTSSEDGTARIWDAENGKQILQLQVPGEHIYQSRYSPDGRLIVSLGSDRRVRVWNADVGTLAWVGKLGSQDYSSVAFSPDGSRLATLAYIRPNGHLFPDYIAGDMQSLDPRRSSGLGSGTELDINAHNRLINTTDIYLGLWELKTGSLIREQRLPDEAIAHISFSSDGRKLLVSPMLPFGFGGRAAAQLWDVESGGLQGLSTQDQSLKQAILSPDGERLAAVWVPHDRDGNEYIQIWQLATKRRVATIVGHFGSVADLNFSPDGRYLVTAHGDKAARVWEVDSGKVVAELGGHRDGVLRASFSPDGRYVQTTGDDQLIRIWSLVGGELLSEFGGHTARINSTEFSLDSKWILSASADHTAVIWRADSRPIVAEFTQAQMSVDGKRLLVKTDGGTFACWDTTSGKPLGLTPKMYWKARVSAAEPDGCRIMSSESLLSASGHSETTVRVWDLAENRQLMQVSGHAVDFSANGQRLLIASMDSASIRTQVWDVERGRQIVDFQNPGFQHGLAAISPDGRVLAQAQDGLTAGSQRVRLWDLDEGRWLGDLLPESSGQLSRLVLSPDGRRLAVSHGFTISISLWNTETGQKLVQLGSQWKSMESIVFSPDSSRWLVLGRESKPSIWDANTGKAVAELNETEDAVLSAAFSSDHLLMVTIGTDKKIRLWETDTGRLLREIQSPIGLTRAAFTADGKHLFIVDQYEKARLWSISPETRLSAETAQLLSCFLGRKLEGSVAVPATPTPQACTQLKRRPPAARWTPLEDPPVADRISPARFQDLAAAARQLSPEPAAQAEQFMAIARTAHEILRQPIVALWAWLEALRITPDSKSARSNLLETRLALGQYQMVLEDAEATFDIQDTVGGRIAIAAISWAASFYRADAGQMAQWGERLLQAYATMPDGTATGWTFGATREILKQLHASPIGESGTAEVLHQIELPKNEDHADKLRQIVRQYIEFDRMRHARLQATPHGDSQVSTPPASREPSLQ